MPITIKTGAMKYKKPNGEYDGFNAIAQESTDQQIASIQTAGAAQVNAVQTTGAAQVSAVQQKGAETLDSIPDDYTELAGDVSSLKSAIPQSIDNAIAPTLDTVETLNLADMEQQQLGYVKSDGSFITTSTHKIVKIDASNLRYVAFKPATALPTSLAYGVLKKANGNIIQVFVCDNTTDIAEYYFPNPILGSVLYISWFNYASKPDLYYDSVDTKSYKNTWQAYGREYMLGSRYKSCVKKPFDFNGKSCYFFGDSITYGYIRASGGVPEHQATNQYPKVFSEHVGASYENYGESNTTLAPSTYGSIFTKIQNTTLDSDFVFIAGGINDWQVGISESDFKTALENICSYLSNNFNGEVIFITPINESGRNPIQMPKMTLQTVRDIITRSALKYGFSVVQGCEFPFPTISDDASYKTLVFQDNIHPTELGYAMYAKALQNALC